MKKILVSISFLIVSFFAFAQTPHVDITVDNTTNVSVQASFAKNSSCYSYHILMSTEAEMIQWSTMFGVPVDSLVRQWGIRCFADTTYTWTSMDPATEYTIYALPSDASNSFYPMQAVTATTTAGGGTGLSTLTINITDITFNSARVIVTPNSETSVFYDGLIRKSYADSIGMDSCIKIIKSSPYPQYSTDNWVWSNLESNTAFYAIAIGKNANSEWGDSTVVEFSTLTLSLIESFSLKPLVIYPNPCSDIFYIETEGNTICELQIFDINGKIVYDNKTLNNANEIDVSFLNEGSYIVKLISENEMRAGKIVIGK